MSRLGENRSQVTDMDAGHVLEDAPDVHRQARGNRITAKSRAVAARDSVLIYKAAFPFQISNDYRSHSDPSATRAKGPRTSERLCQREAFAAIRANQTLPLDYQPRCVVIKPI